MTDLQPPPIPDDAAFRETAAASGFDAWGQPIPSNRRGAAYEWLRSIGLTQEDAWSVTEASVHALEQDRPLSVFDVCQGKVDLTGAYRLLAILSTEPTDA